MPSPATYALSLKQPWAALLVHGRKTIEIRSWCWDKLPYGRIRIHAARIPDKRREAWNLVPLELHAASQLVGGFVGEADLTGCVRYENSMDFEADQPRHLNPPSWYQGSRLYGFRFENAQPLPFQPYRGKTLFFLVPDGAPIPIPPT
jgi:hypothetical protein